LIYGIGGLFGTYCGGVLGSRYAALNESLQLKAIAVAQAGFGVISACAYIAGNAYIAFGLMALAFIGSAATYGPHFATIQTLVPAGTRAMAVAILDLFGNLIGMGLGSLIAGLLSDAFRPWAGDESLRYALLCLCPGFLWAAWHVWRAGKTITADLATPAAQA